MDRIETYENDLKYCNNIIKDKDDNYILEPSFKKDGDKIITTRKSCDCKQHNCNLCMYYNQLRNGGYCDIYNELLKVEPNHIVFCSSVVNCEAYHPIKKLNIINNIDEMVKFIEKTKNFFDCVEDYENYYGFERNWNEETGEILETVREYFDRGGTFKNIPTQYPCVINFDLNIYEPLDFIYIGK